MTEPRSLQIWTETNQDSYDILVFFINVVIFFEYFIKALCSELFSVKALSARLGKLTELTKRLIMIIIVSFIIFSIKINDYNKQKWQVLLAIFVIDKNGK